MAFRAWGVGSLRTCFPWLCEGTCIRHTGSTGKPLLVTRDDWKVAPPCDSFFRLSDNVNNTSCVVIYQHCSTSCLFARPPFHFAIMTSTSDTTASKPEFILHTCARVSSVSRTRTDLDSAVGTTVPPARVACVLP